MAQTYQNLEIILVDDGSPDGSPALCDIYAGKDPRVRVIHKENGGVSTARNVGICAAAGTYVAFVDSDDYVEPDYCEALYKAMQKALPKEPGHVDGGIVICGYHHHYVGADVEKLPGEQDDLLELYRTGFLNMPWNKLFLRADLGAFPEELDLGEDLLFNLEYLKGCRQIVSVGKPLYHYIQEESGKTLSSQKRENKLELAKLIRRKTGAFFAEREQARCGMISADEEQRIHRVADTRFLCECLDDVERLPFDKGMTGAQKRAVIRSLCQDLEVKDACRYAVPDPLDYRILQWCMGRGMVWSTYLLSVLRSFAVRLKHSLN